MVSCLRSTSIIRLTSGLASRPTTSSSRSTLLRCQLSTNSGASSQLSQKSSIYKFQVSSPSNSASSSSQLLSSQFSYSSSAYSTAVNAKLDIVDELAGEFESSLSISGNSAHADAANQAWAAFETLKAEKGGSLSESEYIESLRSIATARDFNRAYSIVNEMKSNGISVGSEAYSLLLNSGRRTLRLSEIRQLFGDADDFYQHQNKRRDNSENEHRNNVSEAVQTKSHYFEQMSIVLKEMNAENIRPTPWFYEELANFLTITNQAGILINIATAMEKRGEQPSTKFYNRMLHCLPRSGLIDRASMLFNRMVLRGTADYYSYLVRASSLVYVNQAEAARAILSDMKGKFSMDSVAYNVLIKSYLSQKNSEQALQVFQQMTRDSAIAPTRVTCRTFMSYFYESADLSGAEPIIAYFPKANFPETAEDCGNVMKFFARYDPSKVLQFITEFKEQNGGKLASASSGNHIAHAFLRILNDRQVPNDWKKTFGDLAIESFEGESKETVENSLLKYAPELPYHFRMIISKIASPDSATYEIVFKKLLQLRRYDSVKALYQSMFTSETPQSVSVQAVHRNLYLTALLSSRDTAAAAEFIAEMHTRRAPVSGKNLELMEGLGIELPRGALSAQKGYGVTAFQRKNQGQGQGQGSNNNNNNNNFRSQNNNSNNNNSSNNNNRKQSKYSNSNEQQELNII